MLHPHPGSILMQLFHWQFRKFPFCEQSIHFVLGLVNKSQRISARLFIYFHTCAKYIYNLIPLFLLHIIWLGCFCSNNKAKKLCWFPVTRLTPIFCPDPNSFYCLWGQNVSLLSDIHKKYQIVLQVWHIWTALCYGLKIGNSEFSSCERSILEYPFFAHLRRNAPWQRQPHANWKTYLTIIYDTTDPSKAQCILSIYFHFDFFYPGSPLEDSILLWWCHTQ